jgi:hypothetical protein
VLIPTHIAGERRSAVRVRPSRVRNTGPVTVMLPVGDWGRLVVFGPEDVAPASLSAVDYFWAAEPRRLAVVLETSRGSGVPYVAIWPVDEPVPDLADLSLAGVTLAEPNLALTCMACRATFAGLYPDGGIPFFGPNLRRHVLVSGCPSCGADYAASNLQALALLAVT